MFFVEYRKSYCIEDICPSLLSSPGPNPGPNRLPSQIKVEKKGKKEGFGPWAETIFIWATRPLPFKHDGVL